MSEPDELIITGVGSTDWTGGRAPGGGTHTGMCIITMIDGSQYLVNHNPAEVIQRIVSSPSAPMSPAWVSFDKVPGP